jgi:hypothetical protein
MPGASPEASSSDRLFLLELQLLALSYFVENQTRDGLVLDRQHNFEPPRGDGWCSTAATGMGLIALSLAAAAPYRLFTPAEARSRARAALETALDRLRHDHGIMPHFLDANTGATVGADALSTIDSSWLIAGALWAAAFLEDGELRQLADRLYDRVDWLYWSVPEDPAHDGRLHHGEGEDGKKFPGVWDRLDGETVHMYVLAIGAENGKALPAAAWSALEPFYGDVCGLHFNNADLGLFAFQYGLDLLDLRHWHQAGGIDLAAEAVVATRANYLFCRENAERFRTYARFWGLSDGDGPGTPPDRDNYRAYGPGLPLDGTAHLTATLASAAMAPAEVLENLHNADRDTKWKARGRYGFSSINLDRDWIGRDIVAIDAGAAVLALDNVLFGDRVRRVFHSLPCVARALERLGFRPSAAVQTSTPSVNDDV